ncbi:hypothetical protein KC332_g7191 [Hortaea werneckii]|uniref:N-acetyltransferase domain-containing protein n=2 Tax=Hortaea werneckii TaxID=91943 RepID=A0A3M7JEN8_HORWE|nr:hypothetical protein KC342_g16261 [Hortaea werneckii]OTA28860.1 hypothetical protein BTJ68_08381 [Hortaea werneckii EXF-2000]KAI6826108.1 hypothetical protein KC350_g8603 [Hortaea werneckii]KAI6830484.1 hypothetical protein KC358_g6795 [Hortaea werneckii]KAI6931351.1 hypothetical protein KC348_g7293 [Hortaea werneckii]
MTLELSFMEEDDIPAFAAVEAAAMAGWSVARAMDMASKGGEPRQQMVERWAREGLQNDSQQVWLKVTDTELGELVAAALWRFELADQKAGAAGAAGSVPAKRDATVELQGQTRPVPDVIAAMDKIWEAFKCEFVGGRALANLSMLVTHPSHQRRGAASMLVQWGCEKADERGMIAALIATEAGTGVYSRHGFQVMKQTMLDLRPYSVDATDLRIGMLRRPMSREI